MHCNVAEPLETCTLQPIFRTRESFSSVSRPDQFGFSCGSLETSNAINSAAPQSSQKLVLPVSGPSSPWSSISTDDLRLTLGTHALSFPDKPSIGIARSSHPSLIRISDASLQSSNLDSTPDLQTKPVLRMTASEKGSRHARSQLLKPQELQSDQATVLINLAPHQNYHKSVHGKTPVLSRLGSRQERIPEQAPLLQDRLLLRLVLLPSRHGLQQSEAYLCTLRQLDSLHSPSCKKNHTK